MADLQTVARTLLIEFVIFFNETNEHVGFGSVYPSASFFNGSPIQKGAMLVKFASGGPRDRKETEHCFSVWDATKISRVRFLASRIRCGPRYLGTKSRVPMKVNQCLPMKWIFQELLLSATFVFSKTTEQIRTAFKSGIDLLRPISETSKDLHLRKKGVRGRYNILKNSLWAFGTRNI